MGYKYLFKREIHIHHLALLFVMVFIGQALPQVRSLEESSELDSQDMIILGPSTGKAFADSEPSSVPTATTATTAPVRTTTFWRYVPLNSLTIGDMFSQKDNNETSTESSDSDDRPVKLKPHAQTQQWWSYFSGKGDNPARATAANPRTTTPIYELPKEAEVGTSSNGIVDEHYGQNVRDQSSITLNVVDQHNVESQDGHEEHHEETVQEIESPRNTSVQTTTINTFTTKRRPRPTINRFVGSTNFYRPKPSRLTAFLSQAKRPVTSSLNGYQGIVIVNQNQAQGTRDAEIPETDDETEESDENQTEPVQDQKQEDVDNDVESETLAPSTVYTESDLEEESTSLPDWYLTVYPNLGTNRKPSGAVKRPVKYNSNPSLKERIAENYHDKIPFPTFLQAIGGSSAINTAERPHEYVGKPTTSCSENDEQCDENETDSNTTTLAGSEETLDVITDESPTVDEQVQTATPSDNEPVSAVPIQSSMSSIQPSSPALPTFAPLKPLSSSPVPTTSPSPSTFAPSSNSPSQVPSSPPPPTFIQSDFTAESPVVSFKPTFENQLDDLISVNIRLLSTYQSQVNLQKQILDKLRKLRQSVTS